jgi:choline-sulfatase
MILRRIPKILWNLPCVFVALLFGTAGCAFTKAFAEDASPGVNVLLVTVDTLRADHLGCYGYRRIKTPNIDQLASDGVQFNEAYAQVPLTLPSHVVILTGTYPMYNTVRDFTGIGLPGNVGILSEAFQRHGYTTAAFVSALVLDGFWGLRRGFQTYDSVVNAERFESETRTNIQRPAKETVERFLAWFASRPAKPFFAWLHVYDPHSPYEPPEPFFSQYYGHLYDGEIAYCDQQLGRVFSALKHDGVYDRTLIVFLSDHGEALGEHGEDEHGLFLYSATLRVPLIIKVAGGVSSNARKVDTVVGTVDISPTVLQLLRITDPLTKQFQGSSLVSLLNDKVAGGERMAYAETYYPKNSFGWSPLRALIGPRYSYIDAPHPELYGTTKDPSETVNLYVERRAEADAFKARLNELVRRYTAEAIPARGAGPPVDTLEKLRSLGYLAYRAPAAGRDELGNLPDPKEKVKTHRAILRATALSEAGRLTESDRLLHELAPTEPRLYAIPFILGENAFREGHLKEAQRQFLTCLDLNPGFSSALIGAARAYHADRQNDKVKPLLQLALSENPQNFLASYALGVVSSEEKNYALAKTYFHAAIRDRPNFAQAYQGLGIAQVESREYREALPSFERARALGSLNPVLLNFQALAVSNLGDVPKAVELYLRALELKPDYSTARLNLAMAYQVLGQRENARRQFSILCDSDSKLCQQFGQSFEK